MILRVAPSPRRLDYIYIYTPINSDDVGIICLDSLALFSADKTTHIFGV